MNFMNRMLTNEQNGSQNSKCVYDDNPISNANKIDFWNNFAVQMHEAKESESYIFFFCVNSFFYFAYVI